MPSLISDLNGCRVLVTGASRGIGAAVARGFGAAGANVAVHYHRSHLAAAKVVEDIRSFGKFACSISANLVSAEEASGIVEQAVSELGGLDILVNNAGDLIERRHLLEIDEQFVENQWQLNARSTLFTCKGALPWLKLSQCGSIINTCSIAQYNGGGGGSFVYAGSKAFVSTLTRGLARELGPSGIRVNAVAPGVIATELQQRVTEPKTLSEQGNKVPLGRMGVPEDCVGAYLFLACPSLSGYITGQTIDVDGGIRWN